MTNKDNHHKTYHKIRKMVGWLGILLPIALIALSKISFFETKPQPSISHFYFTNLRELFTGTLCAVALFLIRYEGFKGDRFWKNDNLMTNIAGAMALGVAIFPTHPDVCADKVDSLIPICEKWLGWVHYGFAAILFLIMAHLSINIFTLTEPNKSRNTSFVFHENHIYKTCGYAILLFILLIILFSTIWKGKWPSSTFYLEAASLLAFGISWLIKGRGLLWENSKFNEKMYS
ncbi:MAG: hypothetical protein FGM41_00540 [Bacteroidetes bacterium]|jgi:hypothetical protein|nr:hypothetical protein [Bacteroidota bacterium]